MELIKMFFQKNVTDNIEENNKSSQTNSITTQSYWMDMKNEEILRNEHTIERLRSEIEILKNLVRQKDNKIFQLSKSISFLKSTIYNSCEYEQNLS